MVASLERIEAALRALGRTEALRRLLPGVRPETVRERLGEVGLDACRDLLELYAWHGGTRVDASTTLDDVHMFPGFYLLALDDALANYVAFRDDARWNRDWFPAFANGGGDFYAVWLKDGAGAVVGFLIDQPEQPVEYESLATMFATLADCYDEGVFFVDDRGYLEMDDARHIDIARRHNPGVALWTGG
jgi:cell wall assembly regulator SMI1